MQKPVVCSMVRPLTCSMVCGESPELVEPTWEPLDPISTTVNLSGSPTISVAAPGPVGVTTTLSEPAQPGRLYRLRVIINVSRPTSTIILRLGGGLVLSVPLLSYGPTIGTMLLDTVFYAVGGITHIGLLFGSYILADVFTITRCSLRLL